MYSTASTGTPQLVTVTPVNSTTVNVSWSEVQCFNGSGAVTHYLVQYQSMCGGAVQNVTTGGLVQTVSGLTPNVAVYTFQVAAVGASQKIGPFSTPSRTCPHSKLYKINAYMHYSTGQKVNYRQLLAFSLFGQYSEVEPSYLIGLY